VKDAVAVIGTDRRRFRLQGIKEPRGMRLVHELADLVALSQAISASAEEAAPVTRMPAWRRPGPGGPPGLQNRCEQRPCSGGFDSRPPPLPGALLLRLALLFTAYLPSGTGVARF
jgi:hypothetical protein